MLNIKIRKAANKLLLTAGILSLFSIAGVSRIAAQDCGAIVNSTEKRNCWVKKAEAGENNLRGADLTSVISFVRKDFKKADLSGANLSSSYLDGADFTDANLSKARLERTSIRGANFTRANLTEGFLAFSYALRVNFTDAILIKANLGQVKGTAAQFIRTDLTDASLTHGFFNESTFREVNFTRTNLLYAKCNFYCVVDKDKWRSLGGLIE